MRDDGALPAAALPSVPTELVARLGLGERSNALDVLIEVALFRPDEKTFDAVPNSAGTKVIYANRDGSFSTCWAPDWSLHPAKAIAALTATTAAETDAVGIGPLADEPSIAPPSADTPTARPEEA